MTPKEKAWQLIEDMSFSTSCLLDRETGRMIPYQVPANPHVKDCALIMINEIISIVEGYEDALGADQRSDYYIEYWKEVKQEIIKL